MLLHIKLNLVKKIYRNNATGQIRVEGSNKTYANWATLRNQTGMVIPSKLMAQDNPKGGYRKAAENNTTTSTKHTSYTTNKPTTTKHSDLTTKQATKKSTTTARPARSTVTNTTARPTRSTATNSSRTFSSSTPNGNYIVSKGDSLWRIAHNNGMTLNELMRQNPQIKNINQVIHPGDKINVNNNNSSNSVSNNTTNSSKPNIYDIDLGENNNEVTEERRNKIREQIKKGNPVRPEYFAEATSDIRPEIGTTAEDVAKTYVPGTLAPNTLKIPTYTIPSKKRKRK